MTVEDVYGDPEAPLKRVSPADPKDCPPVPHGTERGYQIEYWFGLPRCKECKQAHSKYVVKTRKGSSNGMRGKEQVRDT